MNRFRLIYVSVFVINLIQTSYGQKDDFSFKSALEEIQSNYNSKNYKTTDSLSNIQLELELTDTNRLKILWYITQAKFALKDYTNAKKLLQERIRIRTALPVKDSVYYDWMAKCFMDLGRVNFYLGNLDSAVYGLSSSKAIYEKNNNWFSYTRVVFNLSVVYGEQNKYGQSISLLKQAGKVLSKSENVSDHMYVASATANAFNSLNVLDSALYYNMKAIELAKSIPDSNSLGIYLSNMSQMLVNADRFHEGKVRALQAIKVKSRFTENSSMGFAYDALGRAYNGLKIYDSTLIAYRAALSSYLKEGRTQQVGTCYLNIASAFMDMESLDSAVYYYKKALDIKYKLKQRSGIIICYTALAKIHLYRGKMSKAKSLIDSVKIGLNKNFEFDHFLAHYENLILYNSILGNKKQVIWAMGQYQLYVDSLNNEERQARIDGLRTVFNIQEKEQAIGRLRQQNDLQKLEVKNKDLELKRRNQQIILIVLVLISVSTVLLFIYFRYQINMKNNRQLHEKNKVIEQKNAQLSHLNREIYHRTKNHLQSMSSLLGIQKYQVDDPNTRELIQENENRMHAMGLLHKRLFSNDGLEKVNLKHLVEELLSDLAYTFGMGNELEKKIEIQEMELGVDQMIPITLCLNEAVTNSFKYGLKKQCPKLELSLVRTDKEITIKIKDNGEGFSNAVDLADTSSFGMELMQGMMAQIDGDVTFENEDGAVVKLIFPLED
ncbi:MAG: histidine kinase dimerization/phosphoacceptor domain -containing protein [Bacteroidia bacterium]